MKAIALMTIGSMMVSGTAFAAAPISSIAKPITEIKKEGGAPVQLAVGSKRFVFGGLPNSRKGS